MPGPNRYVRDMVVFLANGDGTWRRTEERHDNVLVDTSTVPALLVADGIEATVQPALGGYQLLEGLVAVIGHRPDGQPRWPRGAS